MRPVLLLLALFSCKTDETPEPSPLFEVPETERWSMPGLLAPAYVVRVEGSVPHVYAANRLDKARVLGFVIARDRFFQIDMKRRLALGEVSALLGDAALSTDMESRGTGMTFLAENLLENVTPEHGAMLDAFAEGINAYIDAVAAGRLPPPSELELAAGFLGAEDPLSLMEPFDRRGLMGVGATVIYNLGYETTALRYHAGYSALPGLFDEAPLGELRQEGVYWDVWDRMDPVRHVASTEGWGADAMARGPLPQARPLPPGMAERLIQRSERIQRRLNRDHEVGFGSNVWAVSGEASADGRALLAGDGHLPLSVPSLFWQVGLDTRELGGPDLRQVGLMLPGLPFMAVGTNGHVAWSQTQLMGDITDWYREEIRLDAQGMPAESLFQGEWHPLQRFEETYEVADVPLLGSEGRTETWTRFTTFDGRWIGAIEGRSASPDEALEAGESLVNVQGDWVVPGDVDGDGVITAVSFAYTGFDAGRLLEAVDGFGLARDVHEFSDAARRLVAYSQNIIVADRHGSILYTPFQAVPCRDYLERGADGLWTEGSHPHLLLDGTRYGAFSVPLDEGRVVPGDGDPYHCAVPFEAMPMGLDPASGFLVNANNDPAGLTFDGMLHNEPYYIGGPWNEGYRADLITRDLQAAIAEGWADLEGMAAIQANDVSPIGEQFTPVLLEAIAVAREADPAAEGAEGRLAALYADDPDALEEVAERLAAWHEAGAHARSGVVTFYHQPEPDDAEHAVATMIFNAWFPRFRGLVFSDEGIPGGAWRPGGGTGQQRLLTLMVESRGENVHGLASFNPETGESAFFDLLHTPEIETSDEIALMALHGALDFLRSTPTGHGEGGFGTEDMDAWLWGLRHYVRFDSLLGGFLGSEYAFLTNQFAITPNLLPLDDDITSGDPRHRLPGFPRPGDQYGVDAANPGFSGTRFSHTSGPVFRMVFGLDEQGVVGLNILPGGQSGLNDSPFFADQAALWLGNEAWPVRFTVQEVVEGATGRETYLPRSP